MKALQSGPTKLGTVLASITALGLVLSGCGSDGDDDPSGAAADSGNQDSNDPSEPMSDSVPFGASIEEYQAAFEDIEPITLRFQTTGPEGSLDNAAQVAYGEALTEWSGGKITFEWGHSNSFVPSATEWAVGLGDGRIDIGLFLPYYNPDIFPALTDLTSMTFLDGNRPSSSLISSGWVTDAVYSLPVYQEEAAAGNIHILGDAPAVSIAAVFCTEELTSLEDFAGVGVSASGGRVDELRALGMTPQSIAYTELFEALQRSVVECGATVPTAIEAIGAIDLVPYAIADPEAGISGFPSMLAINNDVWESFPTVVQQLFIERLDVLISERPVAQGQRVIDWLDQAVAAGGGLRPLGEDAREALLEANDQLLEDLRANGNDVDALLEIFDEWQGLVDDELYPDLTTNLEEFLLAGGYETVDMEPYLDAIYEEVFLEHRPE